MAFGAPEKQRARERFVEDLLGAPCTFTKAEIEAAAAAVDQWCTDNAASYNAALPNPFKANATAGQKAALLAVVALGRFGG